MFDQKPTTSLIEDLEVLGLLSDGQRAVLKNKAAKAAKALKENMDPMAPDAPPAPPKLHGEPDGDEDPAAAAAAAAPGAPGAPPPPPPAPPPAGMPAGAPGAAPEKPEDEMANYESAWDVIKQYYTLSEKNEKLSEDDYKTVVNAMAYVIETQGKYMGSEMLDKDPETLPGGKSPKWAGKPENDPNTKAPDGIGKFEKDKQKYHLASPKPGEKAESLDSLVSELKQLTTSVSAEDEMQDLGAKIIEGFEHIRDTSTNLAEGFAKQIKESNTQVSASDPRAKLGKFFEGVSKDAKMLLKAISERTTTDVDDAIEDLNSLAKDLKYGLSQLS